MSDIGINEVIAQMRVMASAAQGGNSDVRTTDVDGNFATLMQDSLESVNATMMEAKAKATAFETGDPNVSLTEVMIASQRASLEFQAVTEVRNKLLTAYQEVMSMQV